MTISAIDDTRERQGISTLCDLVLTAHVFSFLRGSLPKSVPLDFGLEKTFALYFYHQHYYPS